MRILIVSAADPFGPSATGITVASLFEGWEDVKIGTLTAEATSDNRGARGPTLHWNPEAALRSTLLAWLRRREQTDYEAGPVAGLSVGRRSSPTGIRHRGLETARALRSLIAARTLIMVKPLSAAREFGPDVIYSLLGGLQWNHMTETLSKVTGAPIVPHFMDDWPASQHAEAVPARWWKHRLDRSVRAVLARAPLGFTIGEAMAEEYQRRYSMPFYPFMRCLVDKKWSVGGAEQRPVGTIRCLYFGGLHLGRAEPLLKIASALDELCKAGLPLRLTLLVPAADRSIYGPRFSEFACVDEVRTVAAEEGEALLSDADVAVHVESFDQRAVTYTRLSLSTKIPSYLRAGLPMLVVGPAEVASVRFVKEHQLGLVHTSDDSKDLARAALRFFRNQEVRLAASTRARDLFCKTFEATTVRAKFRHWLVKASKQRGAGAGMAL